MYKIATFSDIHGNYEALDAILEDIKKNNYDEVIFLGDLISLGPDSKACIKRISEENVRFILGNHDLYYLLGTEKFNIEPEKLEHYYWIYRSLDEDDRRLLDNHDLSYTIYKNGKCLKFTHYFIKDIRNTYPFYSIGTIKRMNVKDILKNLDSDYLFYGHDHESRTLKINDKYLIDVGSSGCVKDDYTFYTSIEFDKEIKIETKRVKFDRKKFVSKLNKMDSPMIDDIKRIHFGE